ncbi:IS66 family transposase [Eleftheria terrae]|uniref:IS66 family transposase n=1 Tax=Eleftheria terrae TaxID=1597781 RepID=UPI00263A3DBA|nr:IS66 family transposase [Eleftheria terrae]WKB52874.1 IS66 family transposase [Eleftheria terrae]
MNPEASLAHLSAEQLRELAARLMGEVRHKQATIDKLTHENATLKRLTFAAGREHFNAEQRSLLEDTLDADLEAVQAELQQLNPAPPATDKGIPKRKPLPAHLPRQEFRHEPESMLCACGCQMKRIGEDVSEKLDHQPGVFTVERHVRGKWACARCERLVQAPVAPHLIDNGIPTAGLLAQVLVAKHADHTPLYRQEGIYARCGVDLPRSSMAQWVGACGVQLQPLVDALKAEMLTHRGLHADETPVPMLDPGGGKTHRAYLWSYCTGQFEDSRIVVYDFAGSRAGKHAVAFLGDWRGALVCDDYSGYEALLAQGVTEAGCLAHARRKFYDLWANNRSQIAEEALGYFGKLYDMERDVQPLDPVARQRIRQELARPVADALHTWLVLHRQKVPDGSATAKAIDYSLGRWTALVRYLDDGALPADNNWAENRIRPIALGRTNWLFAGSLRAGKRAAAVMSLIQSAKLNDIDPWHYLRDVMERLPTQPAARIAELLPHRWTQPSTE